MRIGYGYWGFLGDKKCVEDADGSLVEVSTPDGNAFYSWSIIEELQKQGHIVMELMPDRDFVGYKRYGRELFGAWATDARFKAYEDLELGMDGYIAEANADGSLKMLNVKMNEDAQGLDYVLWEWRWPIPGRNDLATYKSNPSAFQPDFVLQEAWLNMLKAMHVPVIVLDLDYKLTRADIIKYSIAGVIELGDKWENNGLCMSRRLQIPFNFRHIHTFPIVAPEEDVVYVGNRYERDWCVNKYLPKGSIVYGNWLEGNRDSKETWPHLTFRKRLQTAEMYEAYSKASVTPLLGKLEYCEHGFMTARIIEAVFYGCLPLMLKEFRYGEQYIPPRLRPCLIVESKADVLNAAKAYRAAPDIREEAIEMLRYNLSTLMSARQFVNELMSMFRLL